MPAILLWYLLLITPLRRRHLLLFLSLLFRFEISFCIFDWHFISHFCWFHIFFASIYVDVITMPFFTSYTPDFDVFRHFAFADIGDSALFTPGASRLYYCVARFLARRAPMLRVSRCAFASRRQIALSFASLFPLAIIVSPRFRQRYSAFAPLIAPLRYAMAPYAAFHVSTPRWCCFTITPLPPARRDAASASHYEYLAPYRFLRWRHAFWLIATLRLCWPFDISPRLRRRLLMRYCHCRFYAILIFAFSADAITLIAADAAYASCFTPLFEPPLIMTPPFSAIWCFAAR